MTSRVELATVPWYPQLSTFRRPEMPGGAVLLVLDAAAYCRAMGAMLMDACLLELMVYLDCDEERCREVMWVAEQLGLLVVQSSVGEA